jgi:hypothetical protein
MRRRYIAGSGSFGCLYDSSEEFGSKREAFRYLIDLFDLKGTRRAGCLRRDDYVDLPRGSGADYAEVVEMEQAGNGLTTPPRRDMLGKSIRRP